MLSVHRRGDNPAGKECIQVNRINIRKNDAGLFAEVFKETALRDKFGGLAWWRIEMKGIPRLQSINFARVIAGARRVTKTGRTK